MKLWSRVRAQQGRFTHGSMILNLHGDCICKMRTKEGIQGALEVLSLGTLGKQWILIDTGSQEEKIAVLGDRKRVYI